MNSIEEQFLNDVLGTPDLFKEKLISDLRFSENNYTYIILYVSSINKVKLSFTNKLGQKFYPHFTNIYFSSYIHKQQDMDGAGFVNYEDPMNSSYFNLKPFQSVFHGKSRRSQDLWGLSLCFVLPNRFVNLISAIEFEEVQRGNSSDGMDNTPLIKLQEWRIINNQTQVETLINENLPTVNTDYKKYTF